MSLRVFLSAFLFVVFTLPSLRAADRLNVLFLFSDDQRADTIAALGNEHISTPNLDRLVQEGTSFTRAYCMGSTVPAVCVPSRAMLMTGRPLSKINNQLQDQDTWPASFGRAGYETFITGKWHNGGASLLKAFQQGEGIFLGGMGDPDTISVQDIREQGKLINKRVTEKHCVELFADKAIDFLNQDHHGGPWLCYVAFNAPHDPRKAPSAWHERSNENKPPVPVNFLPRHPFDNGELEIRDEKLAPWPRTPEIIQQELADYYAAIGYMDHQIGRILDELKTSGQWEKTIIVFSSDHGLALGSHGLMGKQNMYDHSMHSPLIISGPGVPKAARRDALCYLFDVFPTLGAMTEVPAPEGSEGLSLVPVLRGESTPVRDKIITFYRDVQRAVRDERWKLISYPKINKTQLFDLQSDPHEMKDLAGDPAFGAEVARLGKLLEVETK